ncbi:hypothetical protein HOF78_01095 [Candidatus Woesearchaeota archaeon]|jgi:hypothetical protein|nr:hypothetical protein [Candidatus Woesearchaeota archaeon]MBT6045018.1 hypothetical protein [Candidatus Woesearchaeota archaeon]
MSRGAFLLALLLLTPLTVSGLGISPADVYIDFKPYEEGEFEVRVINNDLEPVNASLNVQGELEEYFKIVDNVKEIPAEGSLPFLISYVLPKSINTPGQNKLDLMVTDLSEITGGVSAILNVAARIVIDVPYPDKFAQHSFSVVSVNEGEMINFEFNIQSAGEKNIFGLRPFVKVLDSDNKTVLYELEGKMSTYTTGERKNVVLQLNSSEIGKGTFTAETYIDYDGIESPHKNFIFSVGYKDVDVIDYTPFLTPGGIKKIVFTLENKWNSDIDELHIESYLQKDGVPFTERSVSNIANLKALDRVEIPVFIDISNLNTGKYDLIAELHYNDVNEIEIMDFKITEGGFKINKGIIFGFLLLLIVLANIIWLRHYGRPQDKNDGSEDKLKNLQGYLGK